MTIALPSFHVPELLAPAGSWDCAKAAVENGADAIYFGLERFNARMRAHNFTEADLPELMAFLHQRGVKGYVTFNTLVFTQELADAEQYLRSIIAAGVDAAIVQDVGMCRLIRHLSPDFPIHGSTQMTVSNAAGVEFARSIGCNLVVLARECSIAEIEKIQAKIDGGLPLEVFVHGALCVAYSGQCLTSESLGGRSANRGECAQACRMPYDLIVDGQQWDLGDRKYLLSPQDLAGLEVLPDLIRTGVTSLKIEGRLKTPEYVAAVTRTYRDAIDRIVQGFEHEVSAGDRYTLEMAFSRGLSTGWMNGIDNQRLVHAQFGKKRGVFLGEVSKIYDGREKQIALRLQAPLKAGDGVVFDSGNPQQEQGGRIYAVESRGKETLVTFGRQAIDLRRVKVGDRLWKTSDPELDRQLRQTFTAEKPQFQREIAIEVHGAIGEPLVAIVRDEIGHVIEVASEMPLIEAQNQQLTSDRLQEQFGRLGNTPFRLGTLANHLQGAVLLPVSELNRMRREFVRQLEQLRAQPKRWQLHRDRSFTDLLPTIDSVPPVEPELIVLVRNLDQLKAAIDSHSQTIYCEFEDVRLYRQAVQKVRQSNHATIWVAPPRITKPGENYILKQVLASEADGYLVRNYDHLKFFADRRCIGDFSLNVANPIAADLFKSQGLERLTASYDLNITQLEALLKYCPPNWFEVTIHQHMPMFHMEHCVFCAFLSEGTDYTNCGRPCETHEVKLRDRVGTEHILQADAGCRNTVFNGTAQTGAELVQHLLKLGLRHFRIEFVNETPDQVRQTIDRYQDLLEGKITGAQLWRELKLQNQLGVTRGTLESESSKAVLR
ncbi:U32 family peptidase [Microcoleus sp. FACHB-1515]|uniref:U32 family peptidase n=1 Tax=Cyanophyceae TaxID=3028117 RepID=UPI0016848C49|nr:U32 family peptidase [Microcoleus sp. FACHB-1515]MBD2089617.1 U32 family peptidase [Microcoleus sp. FACHB-1515]